MRVLIQRLLCETAQEPPQRLKPTTVTASPHKAKKTAQTRVNAHAGGLGCPTAFLLSSLSSGGVVQPLQSLTQPCPAWQRLARDRTRQIVPRQPSLSPGFNNGPAPAPPLSLPLTPAQLQSPAVALCHHRRGSSSSSSVFPSVWCRDAFQNFPMSLPGVQGG